jgi:hypothetical protein
VVSVFCIAVSEPKRETMSPRWRFLEEHRRQPHQVGEQACRPLVVQVQRKAHQKPLTKHADGRLGDEQQREAHQQHVEQFAVGADHHLVDDELVEQRGRQREHLQRERQQEQLQQRTAQPQHAASEIA